MEIWKKVPTWDNYLISDRGSLKRIKNRKGEIVNSFVTQRSNDGRYVSLWDKIKKRQISVAVGKLVLLAFVGNPPENSSIVRHLNDVPTDNSLENLSWGSYKDNVVDAVRNGKRGPGTEWSRKKSLSQKGKKKPSVSFSNSKRGVSEETRKKISESLQLYHKKNI